MVMQMGFVMQTRNEILTMMDLNLYLKMVTMKLIYFLTQKDLR